MTAPAKPTNSTALKARVEALEGKLNQVSELKARVEILEGKLDQAAWYLGECQFVLKTIVAQAAMQQLQPMVQQQMQQEIMDRLNTGGLAAGLTPQTMNGHR